MIFDPFGYVNGFYTSMFVIAKSTCSQTTKAVLLQVKICKICYANFDTGSNGKSRLIRGRKSLYSKILRLSVIFAQKAVCVFLSKISPQMKSSQIARVRKFSLNFESKNDALNQKFLSNFCIAALDFEFFCEKFKSALLKFDRNFWFNASFFARISRKFTARDCKLFFAANFGQEKFRKIFVEIPQKFDTQTKTRRNFSGAALEFVFLRKTNSRCWKNPRRVFALRVEFPWEISTKIPSEFCRISKIPS